MQKFYRNSFMDTQVTEIPGAENQQAGVVK